MFLTLPHQWRVLSPVIVCDGRQPDDRTRWRPHTIPIDNTLRTDLRRGCLFLEGKCRLTWGRGAGGDLNRDASWQCARRQYDTECSAG